MCAITSETVFKQPQWVVVRPQKGQYLLYNSRTDELHLIPATGHAAYAFCDGLRTVHEVGAELSSLIDADMLSVQNRLRWFLSQLELRGLVERAHV